MNKLSKYYDISLNNINGIEIDEKFERFVKELNSERLAKRNNAKKRNGPKKTNIEDKEAENILKNIKKKNLLFSNCPTTHKNDIAHSKTEAVEYFTPIKQPVKRELNSCKNISRSNGSIGTSSRTDFNIFNDSPPEAKEKYSSLRIFNEKHSQRKVNYQNPSKKEVKLNQSHKRKKYLPKN